ncbi:MAG: hypothetical protein AB7E80_09360 [Hyphomicrobiaceae bacterium]
MEGFYVGYFTGLMGNAVALFVFKDGIIAGADMGGATYDGTFAPSEDGQNVSGTLTFNVANGATLITGASSGGPVRFEVPITLPTNIANGDLQKINSPVGPINVRFQKIRSF